MRKLALALLLVPTLSFAAPCTPKNFSYVYSTGDGSLSLSGSGNVDEFVSVRKRFENPFFWTRLKGREYVIRDADTIARIRALFAPLRALEPELDRVNDEEEQLDDQMDAISDGPSETRDEARYERLQERMKIVRKRQRELEKIEEEIECKAEKSLIPLIEEAIKNGRATRVKN